MSFLYQYPRAMAVLAVCLILNNILRMCVGQATLLTGAAIGVELFVLVLIALNEGWLRRWRK